MKEHKEIPYYHALDMQVFDELTQNIDIQHVIVIMMCCTNFKSQEIFMKILKLFIYGAIFRKYPSVQNRSDIKNRNELFQFYKMNKDNT